MGINKKSIRWCRFITKMEKIMNKKMVNEKTSYSKEENKKDYTEFKNIISNPPNLKNKSSVVLFVKKLSKLYTKILK